MRVGRRADHNQSTGLEFHSLFDRDCGACSPVVWGMRRHRN